MNIITRHCDRCGKAYEVTPLTVPGFDRAMIAPMCEDCEAVVTAVPEAKPKKLFALGADWPERHRRAIAERSGKALDRAGDLWASHVAAGEAMLILYGDRGRGKTWMAVYWAYLRGHAGRHPGLYCTAYDLFLDLRQAWRPNSPLSERDAMEVYKRAPFLVLDQMHQTRALGSESDKSAMWERMALADLLDYRYRERLATVLILTVATDAEVAQCFDADIIDRVREAGGLVHCNWDSYRAD